jgi:hypothetical protein
MKLVIHSLGASSIANILCHSSGSLGNDPNEVRDPHTMNLTLFGNRVCSDVIQVRLFFFLFETGSHYVA